MAGRLRREAPALLLVCLQIVASSNNDCTLGNVPRCHSVGPPQSLASQLDTTDGRERPTLQGRTLATCPQAGTLSHCG
ncbi:hypothetical protein B0T11DRAFT_285852 [Plectosphaerella cucumerina]|uniref:Uncharacterized protein n=1 Tax=Plectosphaerella cucumerina TaxID=40658 RepID=A0A8K0TAA0_9PEZI|nr:hypothetical protein B0T11DRAFT_285852 [Plectosphaerella cucumerina]